MDRTERFRIAPMARKVDAVRDGRDLMGNDWPDGFHLDSYGMVWERRNGVPKNTLNIGAYERLLTEGLYGDAAPEHPNYRYQRVGEDTV